ncbi:MAG: methyltransferase domain-containing protein [Paracoccaceae bacterium]|nr:methyltransferase domain-containing protein [Paracoccaceae bacterium]
MLDLAADPAAELARYREIEASDTAYRAGFDWSASWRHLEKRLSEGALREMGFTGFDGAALIGRMIRWIDRFDYPCAFADPRLGDLEAAALAADRGGLAGLGLDPGGFDLAAVARYTAQDIFFQRLAVATSGNDRCETVLDFGAGHGRLFDHWVRRARFAFATDAMPGPYLAQRLWAQALGLSINDYIDDPGQFSPRPGVLNHLPAWRLDLLRTGAFDAVFAIQVLREVSKPMLAYTVAEFARLLRPGGRLYIRDHIGFHNVNAGDLDALLKATGFVLEWRPHVIDRRDIHGVPRIWRRADAAVTLGGLV